MAKKVIIIGGGVAGLAAGIYGQLNGFDTEIVEMHTRCGGQCTAWSREGYRFDNCLHWLVGTAAGPFHDLWKETGVLKQDTRVLDHEVYLKLKDAQGREFVIYTDIDKWEGYLLAQFPEDEAAIRRMCHDMRKASSFELLTDPPPLRTWTTYLRAARRMLPALGVFMRYRKRTAREYFDDLNLRNPRLRAALYDLFGDRGFPAVVFLMMLAWFHHKNAGYLIGGSLAISDSMTAKYVSLGGKLSLGQAVKHILVSEGMAVGLILGDGREIRGDYVISAADGHSTLFGMLKGKFLSRPIRDAYANWPLYTPLVQVGFGINRPLPAGSSVEVFLAPGKKIGSTALERSYMLMNYSFDPTMAPDGRSVVMLRFESPWVLWEGLDTATYQQEKQRILADATALLESHYPGIRSSIGITDISTPHTTKRITGVWNGAYEGFLPTNENFYRTLPMTVPGLQNFYMAGQWLSPGGGLPPSALSGKWAIQLICRKERKVFRTREERMAVAQ